MARTLIEKTQIENLQIINADISASAAIASSKLADGANFIKKDGSVAFTADQSQGGFKITNLGAPVSASDAARLQDVQTAAAGISSKEAVRAATTSNITLSGAQTIDTISVVAGDRVLVKDQSTGTQNGIYVAATGAWTRSTDADADPELKPNTFVFVNEGTVNGDTGWMISNNSAITIGVTIITWVQFSGLGQITAGTGMTKTGNTLDVVGTSGRIVANADSVDLATSGVSAGTYTKITVDAYGRATVGATAIPSDIGAQPISANLTNLAAVSSTGIYVSTGTNTNTVRTIAGTAGRVGVTNGDGVSGNPTVDLVTSGVSANTYNSVTVDVYGRVTAATNVATVIQSDFIVRETPSGAVNGVNTTFTLANTPVSGKESVFVNGILQEPGSGNDYTISGATITMLYIPTSNARIRVSYIK